MNNAGRIALIVTGALAALVASALLAGGAAALYGQVQKDDDGYLTSEAHRYDTGTRALATENLDIDLGAADSLADDLGRVKIEAQSNDGKPLFVGIGRTSDVERYLDGVPHATVHDVEDGPFDSFHAETTRHGGNRHPVAPEHAGIWAASSEGTGKQATDVDFREGDWSVVVMNADGSAGVNAGVSAGATANFLTPLAWGTLGGGVLLTAITGGLLFAGLRRPKPPVADQRLSASSVITAS
jgi:hypothetical protein